MNLFLSHAAVDAPLAARIEAALTAELSVSVFRTSRPDQLPPGETWFGHIERHIRDADGSIVLLTPNSVDRPWILFEAGAAWFADRPLIPLVAAGLAKAAVPEPLRLLQLVDLEDQAALAAALQRIGLSSAQSMSLAADAAIIGRTLAAAALAAEGWAQIVHANRRFAWDGPLNRLPLGDGRDQPDKLPDALRSVALRVTRGFAGDVGNEVSKGYRILYEIDRWQTKHYVYGEDAQILLVRPESQ